MDFPIKDIPQDVLDEVCSQLKNYCVPIFGLSPNEPDQHFRLIGSGTLVEIEGKHSILTAAHVWREPRDAEEVGLTLTDFPSYSFVRMPRATIRDLCLWDRPDSEWGPDLALLELALPFVSTIVAHKSFVNLSQKRVEFASCAPNIEKGLWAVTGMVGELSEIYHSEEERTTRAAVHGRAFFSTVHQSHLEGGYDFIDLSAKMDLPDVPSSFGGVSGGGLWEVGLSIGKSGKIFWDEKRNFRGVAFWQSAKSDGRRVIRCHGPRSIFEKGWEVWALPQSNPPHCLTL